MLIIGYPITQANGFNLVSLLRAQQLTVMGLVKLTNKALGQSFPYLWQYQSQEQS